MGMHPGGWFAIVPRIGIGLLAMMQLALSPAFAQVSSQPQTWDAVLAGAPKDGRIPVLLPETELSECDSEYAIPDSVALVSEEYPLGPSVWRWTDTHGIRVTGRPNYGWREVDGPTAPDTIRVAVIGPACDATLRTRPVWGDLTQLLLERDGVIFSVGVNSIRAGRGGLDQFHAVFLVGDGGQVLEARLTNLTPGDQSREGFVLRLYDPAEITKARQARLDSLRERQAFLRARVDSYQKRVDSIAAANDKRAAARRDSAAAAQRAARRDQIRQMASRRGWPGVTTDLVIGQELRIGMDEAMVRAAWGSPRDVNRTITARGTREQWVYGDGRYVYFDDGIVTVIQM